jgi:hypothetical protein
MSEHGVKLRRTQKELFLFCMRLFPILTAPKTDPSVA